jgi:cytochrome b
MGYPNYDRQGLPTIVCLCGSSRFRRAFEVAAMYEALQGRIVVGPGLFGHDDYPVGARALTNDGDEANATKQALDALHLRKIDLADEVLVLNVGGYIGDSTAREIQYARMRDKRIRYLETVGTESVVS